MKSLTPSGSQIENIEFSFFSHLIIFLKAPTDLEFFISTVRLFHSFMQYWEKSIPKGYCS